MGIRAGYKQTEVGIIPEDWDVQNLGAVARVSGGGSFKSQDAVQNGVRWLKIANVGFNEIRWDDESFLPEQFAITHRDFLLKEYDYVIAQTRPILSGLLKIAQIQREDAPALLNQRVGKLESIGDTDLGFLYYLFQKQEIVSALQQSMAGTDPPNLSTRSVYSIVCALPPTLAEQKAIAVALSDTDALIAALEGLIAKKRQIKQGAMQELLTGKKRLPGFEKKNGYKQTEVGIVPEDWDVLYISDVFQFKQGVQTPLELQSADEENEYKRFIRIVDLTNKSEPWRYIADPGSVHHVTPNDLFMVRYGSPGLVGYGYEGVIANNLFRLIPKRKIDSTFFFHYLANRQDEVASISGSSTMPAVNFGILSKLCLIYPSIEEQTDIAEILSDMDAEIEMLEAKLAKSRQVKVGMMQELLTGKVRLV